MPSPVTLQLGGVDLPCSMLWEDRYEFQPVAQSVRRTLGGKLVTFAQGVQKGRPITLTANNDRGWLTLGQVEAIQTLASAVGAVYTLQVDTNFFQVQFRHEEPPAFSARLLNVSTSSLEELPGTFGDPEINYFTATIRLMEV